MKFDLATIVAAACILVPTGPASAVASQDSADVTISKVKNYRDVPDFELLNAYQDGRPRPACQMETILTEIMRRELKPMLAPLRYDAAAQCAIEHNDWPAAYLAIKQWEKLESEHRPDSEAAFRLAYLAGEYDEALDRLDIITKLDDPQMLLKISPDVLFDLARKSGAADREDRVTRQYQILFESPHFALLDDELRSAAASDMLEQYLEQDGGGDVARILARINAPESYVGMLADRKYQPLWPQIEQQAGPNLANILNRYLDDRKKAFAASPRDKMKKQQYGFALLFAGRFDELVTLAATIDHSDTGSRSWDEDDGWLLNLEVYALDALGRTAAANRIYDQFGGIDYQPGQKDWLVSFAINRAARLVDQGRWEQGLAAAREAEQIATANGTAFANMAVKRARICSLHHLGRNEQAQVVWSEIAEHQDDSLVIAASALLCIGERDKAARLVIKGLEDPDRRAGMIGLLQKPEFGLFYSESVLPSIYSELRDHPDVATAYDKVARDVPEEYIPLVGVKRQELAAERQAD